MYTGRSEDHGDYQQIFEPATGSIKKLFLGEYKPHYKKPVFVNLHILRVQLQAMSTLTQRETILLYLLDRRVSGAHCNTVAYTQSSTLLEINPIIQFMAKIITGTAK
jgi:hypothetical protein